MPSPAWDPIFAAELAGRSAGHLLRNRRVVRPIDAVRVIVDGRELVNFASNDYLGLARHPRVIEAARRAAETYGVGSGAAPLITGYTPAHVAAEASIARWKGTEAAVLFPSGYQANVAVVQALAAVAGRAGRPVRFLLDKLCHASLVDAVRAVADDRSGDSRGAGGPAAASYRIFPHNGTAKLARLLNPDPYITTTPSLDLRRARETSSAGHLRSRNREGAGESNGAEGREPAWPTQESTESILDVPSVSTPPLPDGRGSLNASRSAASPADAPRPSRLDVILTESIFSMDGDAADLPALASLKRDAATHGHATAGGPAASPPLLVVDEAHGSGVYGPDGAGLTAELGLSAAVDVTVVTLSKAVGVGGAAVCGSRAFCDVLVNLGRAYVFSTSIPPMAAAAAEASVGVMRDEPHRQRRVRALARHVRAELSAAGLALPPGDSPIVPLVLGDEQAALAAADRLADLGLLALAIRPPTVARGTSRLRVTLSSEHTDGQVEALLAGLRELRP